MRQHCTDGSFRFCRWRAHTEAFSEDSGPEALSTQGQYFALHVFYEILKHIAGELSANCCRSITMTRYTLWGIVSRVAGLREGVLCFVWFREKKAGKVARRVHDTPDFNALRERLIKDEVVLEAAHTPAPHTCEPGVVKILGVAHARHGGQRGKRLLC